MLACVIAVRSGNARAKEQIWGGMAYALTDFCETLRLCRGALRWYRACGRRREDRRRYSQFRVHLHHRLDDEPADHG